MIIKKYEAYTMSEALNSIKHEMGPEAVIISKRQVRQKGLLGFFKPKRLEITAAVDENIKKESIKEEKVIDKQSNNNKDIEKELNEVKDMLQKLMDKKKGKKEKKIGVKKMLIERDVDEEVINSITSNLKSRDEYKDTTRIPDKAIAEEICALVSTGIGREGRVHALIGPTGVGKTTTIAKLAAINSLHTEKKVGLLTIDTYRIGAVEQLKIYADILRMPFEVVNSVSAIEKSMDNLKDCDMVFVDTTGRSIKNVMQLSELKLYLDRIKPDSIHLVLSMTTKYCDLQNIVNGFSAMNYNSVILTKFDETSTYGSVINIAHNTKVPISYITIGQNVPDDIEAADKQKLLNLVLGEGSI